LDVTKPVKYPCLILKPDGSSTTFPAHPEVGSHARFKDWSLGSTAGGSTVEIVVDFTIHNESYIDVEMTFSNIDATWEALFSDSSRLPTLWKIDDACHCAEVEDDSTQLATKIYTIGSTSGKHNHHVDFDYNDLKDRCLMLLQEKPFSEDRYNVESRWVEVKMSDYNILVRSTGIGTAFLSCFVLYSMCTFTLL